MARTAISVTVAGLNGSAVMTATTIYGATGTNGFVVEDSVKDANLSLIIQNDGVTGSIEIKAGTSFDGVGIGDATYVIAANSKVAIGPFDGFRFRNGIDGYIDVDSIGITGMAYAIENRPF